MDNFKEWLTSRLKPLEIDESVFGEYIIGILEDNDNENEKIESLEGILPDMSDVIKEIVQKWKDIHSNANEQEQSDKSKEIDIVKDMADILEKKLATSASVKTYTDEEKRIREQILQTYSQTDVPEHDDDSEEFLGDDTENAGLEKNTNFLDVQLAQKARREAAKAESLKKKEKDKEDREKQKQLREQKKEKRKTVKQERRK